MRLFGHVGRGEGARGQGQRARAARAERDGAGESQEETREDGEQAYGRRVRVIYS